MCSICPAIRPQMPPLFFYNLYGNEFVAILNTNILVTKLPRLLAYLQYHRDHRDYKTEEVGQLLAKHHGKFACFSTQCLIHAWTVAKRTSLCDKEIWKLSKDRTVRLQYFQKIA